jgi:hypothetical protein
MSIGIGFRETGLEVADDRAELARGEEPGPERARRVFTDGRESSQGGTNLCRHVVELPADLVFDGFWPSRVRKAGGFDGISGGPECVRAHMAHGDGLTGGPGGGRRGGSLYITGTDATGKPTANLLGSV